jgi:putative pyruvate formate lyase activating enzyme
MICRECPRACGQERGETSGRGFCGQGIQPRVARAALHLWEEPCTSGVHGSGAIFFSGCTLKCLFCQNTEISHGGKGIAITPARLAEIVRELEAQGAETINLVTPGHFADAIREALCLYRPAVPVVYNTSGYESLSVLEKMADVVDVYLPDLKTLSSRMAGKLFRAADYPEAATQAILEMVRQKGSPVYNDAGIVQRGVVIRHLVLPGHLENTRAVLRWVADAFLPGQVLVSLMAQYTPCGELEAFPELRRTLSAEEWAAALAMLEEFGLEDGYFQEPDAAGEEAIPSFDGTGVLEKTN